MKFPGDCWPRCPGMPGSSNLQSPSEHAMEVSTADQMEISASTEVTAPLPIRQPTGSAMGAFKQQAYPVMAKRPEHLRMNLWPVTYDLEIYYNLLSVSFIWILGGGGKKKNNNKNSLPSQNLVFTDLMSMCASLISRNCFSSSRPKNLKPTLLSDALCHIRWIIRLGSSFGWFFFYMIVPSKEYETHEQ